MWQRYVHSVANLSSIRQRTRVSVRKYDDDDPLQFDELSGTVPYGTSHDPTTRCTVDIAYIHGCPRRPVPRTCSATKIVWHRMAHPTPPTGTVPLTSPTRKDIRGAQYRTFSPTKFVLPFNVEIERSDENSSSPTGCNWLPTVLQRAYGN